MNQIGIGTHALGKNILHSLGGVELLKLECFEQYYSGNFSYLLTWNFIFTLCVGLDTTADPHNAPPKLRLVPAHKYWPDPFPFSEASSFFSYKGLNKPTSVSILNIAVNLKVLTCTTWSCEDGISQGYH